jgi:PAS domain S-box-containing protein/LPXTG-motif cell wall-anchored protein
MTGAYVYTPAIWPPLLGALLLAATGLYSWRRRRVPGALPLCVGALLGAAMLVGMAFEVAAVSPSAKIGWYKLVMPIGLASATAFTCFTLEYTRPGRWLSPRNLVLLGIPPLLCLLLALVDDARLLVRTTGVRPDGTVLIANTLLGTAFVAYLWGLVLVNAAAFLWLFARSPQHRWPVAIMLAGQLANRAFYFLDIAGLSVPLPFAPAVLAVVVPATAYAIALFGFRIFDPLPAARLVVIEQMQAGVVVFDTRSRVQSLNPAAERILGIPAARARGKTWNQVAPAAGHLLDPAKAGTHSGEARELPEIEFEGGSQARIYSPALSPLTDPRGLLAGRLLVLRDVTGQKQAQAQIVEQQRSLATLREREHLARELHDSIGQVLAYAIFQVETVDHLIDEGQAPAAQAQLQRLVSVLGEAHADVRQQILDLHFTPTARRPFLAAIRRYLEGFGSNYDVQTRLIVATGLDDVTFSQETQAQLHRVLQEALSNVRKHSRARRVEVTFEADDDQLVRMTVEDDGTGFDPTGLGPTGCQPGETGGAGANHLGLQFMAERAAALGGSLLVDSAPGKGTRLVVEVPRDGR